MQSGDERRFLAELDRLAAAVEALASELPLSAVLERIARSAAAALGTTMGSISLLDEARGELRVCAATGLSREYLDAWSAFPLGVGACGRAAETGLPYIVGDVDTDPAFAETRELARRAGIRALFSVPIVGRGGRLLGALASHFPEPTTPSGDDLRRSALYAKLAAVALDQHRLIERARVQAEDAGRQTAEAMGLRDDFLAVAGHELRTPLTALQLQVHSIPRMAREGAPLAAIEERARKAGRNIERLTRLIDELLDASRITAGRLTLELEEMDLAAVVRETISRMAEELGRARCEVRIESAGPVVGRWDRLRIEQITSSLVANALKYGEGRPIEIRVEAAGERRARLAVRDQGIGIAPEDQKRIFERFERAVSSRHFGGLGLGLWIVRQLVNAHGGTIRVESTPGEGARFEIDLPRHDAESTPKASAAGGPDAPPGVRSGAAAAAERAGRGEE